MTELTLDQLRIFTAELRKRNPGFCASWTPKPARADTNSD